MYIMCVYIYICRLHTYLTRYGVSSYLVRIHFSKPDNVKIRGICVSLRSLMLMMLADLLIHCTYMLPPQQLMCGMILHEWAICSIGWW